MSESNVEIVRSKFKAVSRGAFDEAFGDVTRDFELDMSRALGVYRGVYGVDDVQGFVSEFAGTFDTFRARADEYIEVGALVVTPFTNTATSREGMEVHARGAWVWTFRDGALARVCLYQELPEALAAAGLAE
jgi:ketosteroid isomerase-like protein